MKKNLCLVLYFVHFENLGTLKSLLRHDYEIKYHHFSNFIMWEDLFFKSDLVIVLGGPLGVNDSSVFPNLTKILHCIEKRIKMRKFIFGICLGAQLIAKALGASIYKISEFEIGWGKLSLTGEGRNSCLKYLENFTVLHWHQETFELPKDCLRLASSKYTKNQAFSYGDNILGIQFHCEVEPGFFEFWLAGHFYELKQKAVDIKRIREDSDLYVYPLVNACKRFFNAYISDSQKNNYW